MTVPIQTAITELVPGSIRVRGYPLDELIGNISYTEAVYLCVKGELPSKDVSKMLEALMMAIMDHSLWGAATPAARIVCGGNPDPLHGICAGILSIGPVTGSPRHSAHFVQSAYKLMIDKKLSQEKAADIIIEDYISRKERIPGFGHPLFRLPNDPDIRARRLRELAERHGFIGEKVKLYECIHSRYLNKIEKHNLVINVDGMMGAIMSEMDFDDDMIDIIGIFSYLPGICAHTYEELKTKSSIGLIAAINEGVKYNGPTARRLPKDRL
jgi:citryl-CoA lyase